MVFCRACGNQLPDNAVFCANCGAATGAEAMPEQLTLKVTREPAPAPPPAAAPSMSPVPPPTTTPPPSPVPPPPPTPREGRYAAPPPPTTPGMYGGPPGPPKNSRLGLWIGIAAAAVIIVAAAVAIPLLLLDRDGGTSGSGTTRPPRTTTTTTAQGSTTTSSATTSSTTTSSTTTTTATRPGDSDGRWTQLTAPEPPEGTYSIKVSDQALLFEANSDSGFALYAYMLDSGQLFRLPTGGDTFFDCDLDGLLAVWRESEYDDETGEHHNARLYAYTLPNGPKVEVSGGIGAYMYPQVAAPWVTWVESAPWDADPDYYFLQHIYGVQIRENGEPTSRPVELVSTATADVYSDSYWTYTLSPTHLAWEVATAVDIFDEGTYVMDLASRRPLKVGDQNALPSLGDGILAIWSWAGEGVQAYDLETGRITTIDRSGEYPSAGATFTAYFRGRELDDAWSYELTTRGNQTGRLQMLVETDSDPYFMPPIAVSAHHVAALIDEVLYLFEWQAR